jgi:hypothetical protein
VRSTVVDRPYRALALCVFDGVSGLPRSLWLARAGNAAYQFVDYQPDPRIAVIGTTGTSPSTDVEVLFTSATATSTRVDIRLGFSDAIGRHRYEGVVWRAGWLCGAAIRSAGRTVRRSRQRRPGKLSAL